MRSPLFSVIIPALNEEKFLPNLLASLSQQSKKNFEVIVVDGKSKDETVRLAKRFASKLPKLRVLSSTRANLPLQRNTGAKAAEGEWLVFVDADSVLLPHFITQIDQFIREHNPKLFTSWCRPDSEEVADATMILFWNIVLESAIRFKRPLAPGPLTIVKKTIFNEVDGYDEKHEFNEDMDFSFRMLKHGVSLQILRETLYVVSLRRFRAQGTLKVAQQYIQALLPIIFFKRTMSTMPGYIMGGHLYKHKKLPKRSVLKVYEKKLKLLMKELFS